MLDHVADFVRGGLIKSVMVIASVNDEDVAFLNLDALLDHVRGVDVVIADDIGQIDNDAFVHKEIEIKLGDVLARCVEVNLTIQVRADVVGMRHQLAVGTIGCQALEILHL